VDIAKGEQVEGELDAFISKRERDIPGGPRGGRVLAIG
jgi:hypothetical protein